MFNSSEVISIVGDMLGDTPTSVTSVFCYKNGTEECQDGLFAYVGAGTMITVFASLIALGIVIRYFKKLIGNKV